MYAQVVPLRRMPRALSVLDYRIPRGMNAPVGSLVQIPFRTRKIFGIVNALSKTTNVPEKSLQEVQKVFGNEPLLSTPSLHLAHDIAHRYTTPLPTVIATLCPPLQPRKLTTMALEPFAMVPKRGFESRYLWYRDVKEKHRWFGEHWPKDDEQTLIIVPEKWHLREWEEMVGTHVTLSSDLSPKEHFERYFTIRNGEVPLILGTKVALFAPYKNLTHIIVDFEHSPHHKNWDQAPRYHARDAAMQLAELWQCPVTIMSHTPSVESAARLTAHSFMRAHTETTKKEIRVIDLKEEYQKKNFGIFSDAAHEAIARAIEERKDILVMVHRRGAYTTVSCRDCGRIERCANCSLPLIYHEQDKQLHCHPCHHTQLLRETCAFCRGPRMIFRGVGTQAVEDAVRTLLHDSPYTVHRADADSDTPRFDVERPAAVVGTSRALSFVRWGRIGLVIFNDIDGFLSLPEYRATAEFVGLVRDIQYLAPAHAAILLQTREPQRLVLGALQSGGLGEWYREELSLRQQLHYPPFWSILKLTYWGPSYDDAFRAATEMTAKLQRLTEGAKNAMLTHPYAAHPAIRKGLHGIVVLLRTPTPVILDQLALAEGWKVDVDPLQLLS
ncbi:MAG: primosomal protein N' [Patescibacteria group bacterium]